MSQLAEFEKRAREAVLGRVIEAYRREHPDWQNEPMLFISVLMTCLCSWSNVALLGTSLLVSGLLLAVIRPLPVVALVVVIVLAGVVEVIFLFIAGADSHRLTAAAMRLHSPGTVFALETIHSKNLRAKLAKALLYWGLIDNMQRSQPEGVLGDRLTRTTLEMTRWLQGIYHLAGWLDRYNSNVTIHRDWQTLPQIIQSYEQKLSREQSPDLRAHLQQALAYKQQQLCTLDELRNQVKRATYQLDSTIASMGVIYSQLLLLVSTRDVESGRINRLQADISEEVERLEDLTAAMSEFYRVDVQLTLSS